MGQCFRPVKELWNSHSSCFVEPKGLITLLHDLAARVGTVSDEHNYGDNTAVWFENGLRMALDYVRSDHRFNAESLKGSLKEQGVLVEADALVPLLPIFRAYRTNGSIRLESTGNWSFISTTADDLA